MLTKFRDFLRLTLGKHYGHFALKDIFNKSFFKMLFGALVTLVILVTMYLLIKLTRSFDPNDMFLSAFSPPNPDRWNVFGPLGILWFGVAIIFSNGWFHNLCSNVAFWLLGGTIGIGLIYLCFIIAEAIAPIFGIWRHPEFAFPYHEIFMTVAILGVSAIVLVLLVFSNAISKTSKKSEFMLKVEQTKNIPRIFLGILFVIIATLSFVWGN